MYMFHNGIIASLSYGVGNDLAWTVFHASDLNDAASPDITSGSATFLPSNPYDAGDYVVVPHTLTSTSRAGWNSGVAWRADSVDSPYTDANKISVLGISIEGDTNRHATTGNSLLGFGEYGVVGRSTLDTYYLSTSLPRNAMWISASVAGGSASEAGRFPQKDGAASMSCVVRLNGSGSGKDYWHIGTLTETTLNAYQAWSLSSGGAITNTSSKVGLVLSNTGSGGANNGLTTELAAKIKYVWNEIDLTNDWKTLSTSDFVSTTPYRDTGAHCTVLPTDGPNGGISFDMDKLVSSDAISNSTVWKLNMPAEFNNKGNQLWVHEFTFPVGIDAVTDQGLIGIGFYASNYKDFNVSMAGGGFFGFLLASTGGGAYNITPSLKTSAGYTNGTSIAYASGDKLYLITFLPPRNSPQNMWVITDSAGVVKRTYGVGNTFFSRYRGKLRYCLFQHFTAAGGTNFKSEIKIRRKLVYWSPDDAFQEVPDINYTNSLAWTKLTTSHFVNPLATTGGSNIGSLNPGAITDAGSDRLSVTYTTPSVTPGDGVGEGNFWRLNCYTAPSGYELKIFSCSHEFDRTLSAYETYEVLGLAVGVDGTGQQGCGLAFNNGSNCSLSMNSNTADVQLVSWSGTEEARFSFFSAGSQSGTGLAVWIPYGTPKDPINNITGVFSASWSSVYYASGTLTAKMYLASNAIPVPSKRGFSNTIYGKYKFLETTLSFSTGWTEITANDISLHADPDGIAGTPVTSDVNGLGFNINFAGVRDGILECPVYKINNLPRLRRDGTQCVAFRISVNSISGINDGGGLHVVNYGYGHTVRGAGIYYLHSSTRLRAMNMTSETSSPTSGDTHAAAPTAGEHVIAMFNYPPFDGEYVPCQLILHYNGSNNLVSIQTDSFGSLSSPSTWWPDHWYLCPVSLIGALNMTDATRFKVEYKVFDIFPANEFDGD